MQVGDTHQELAEVLGELEHLGARIPTFTVANLSEHEAVLWLRSEKARLALLTRTTGELHVP